MHLTESQIALSRSGDLGWMERMKAAAHLRVCDSCRQRQTEYATAHAELRMMADELPTSLNWDSLAREMTANINLGVTAGRIVAQAERPAHLTGWRPAIVFASALLVVVGAWYANSHGKAVVPTNMVAAPVVKQAAPGVPTLRVDDRGIGLNDPDRVLTLMHPSRGAVFSVNMQGSVRARYVDAESGQVTINHVYVQ